jgi:hypothetical protein
LILLMLDVTLLMSFWVVITRESRHISRVTGIYLWLLLERFTRFSISIYFDIYCDNILLASVIAYHKLPAMAPMPTDIDNHRMDASPHNGSSYLIYIVQESTSSHISLKTIISKK